MNFVSSQRFKGRNEDVLGDQFWCLKICKDQARREGIKHPNEPLRRHRQILCRNDFNDFLRHPFINNRVLPGHAIAHRFVRQNIELERRRGSGLPLPGIRLSGNGLAQNTHLLLETQASLQRGNNRFPVVCYQG